MRQQPVQARNPGIPDALDPVAHDFSRHSRFLGHRQVARAGAEHGDGTGPFRQRLFLDGHTSGDRVMNGPLEFFAQCPGVFGRGAGDEHPLFQRQDFRGDVHHLFRCFAGTKNHFRKPLAQGTMRVHLGKAKIGQRRGLKGAQDPAAADFPGAEFFQKFYGFRCRHVGF